MKYFGEEMTPEDIQTVEFVNNSFKDKSSYYSFEKPPAEISIVWNLDDWFDWLDRCWKKGDNNDNITTNRLSYRHKNNNA